MHQKQNILFRLPNIPKWNFINQKLVRLHVCTLQTKVLNTRIRTGYHREYPVCTLQIKVLNTYVPYRERFRPPVCTLQTKVLNT